MSGALPILPTAELAQAIAHADNTLTARVMVNRVWQHHFGEGLVRTPGNFGKLGELNYGPAAVTAQYHFTPGRPLDLYNHPANRFVASFIGA